jgi:hypothetical protein
VGDQIFQERRRALLAACLQAWWQRTALLRAVEEGVRAMMRRLLEDAFRAWRLHARRAAFLVRGRGPAAGCLSPVGKEGWSVSHMCLCQALRRQQQVVRLCRNRDWRVSACRKIKHLIWSMRGACASGPYHRAMQTKQACAG